MFLVNYDGKMNNPSRDYMGHFLPILKGMLRFFQYRPKPTQRSTSLIIIIIIIIIIIYIEREREKRKWEKESEVKLFLGLEIGLDGNKYL